MPTVFIFNSGSSSLKFGSYSFDPMLNESQAIKTAKLSMLFEGVLEFNFENRRTGKSSKAQSNSEFNQAKLRILNSKNEVLISETINVSNLLDAAHIIVRQLTDFNMPAPVVIGHRVVHGGAKLRHHCLINDEVLQQLKLACAFAPLHNKNALSLIDITKTIFPHLPQVACFDTVFHVELPIVARTLPLSKTLQSDGLQRYGFHGLSCESIIEQLSDKLPEKLIIAHLGHGASVTAIKNGQSMDTSMGLTPTGGLMMGSRSGDLDPEILVYLMREKKFDVTMLENLINRESGLLGVSGVSGDLRELHKVASDNPDAQLAINMFCYSAAKQIAGMITTLNGVDMLVFTGGIGENDHLVRYAVCQSLNWAGIILDKTLNQMLVSHSKNNDNQDTVISSIASKCEVRVMPSQEDKQIAFHTTTLWQSVEL